MSDTTEETTTSAAAKAKAKEPMVKVVDTEGGRIRVKEVTQAEAEARAAGRVEDVTDYGAEIIDRLDTQISRYVTATDGLIEIGLANTRPEEAAKMWNEGFRPIDEADAKHLRGFTMMEVPGFGRVPVVQDTMLMGREKKLGDGVRQARNERYAEKRLELFDPKAAEERINQGNGGGDGVIAAGSSVSQREMSIDEAGIFGTMAEDDAFTDAALAGRNMPNNAVSFGFSGAFAKGNSRYEPTGPKPNYGHKPE